MPAAKARPRTFDECLAGASAKQRIVLEKLRKAVHAAAPGVEECVGYGLAAFKLNGHALVYFGAWKEHCALYPGSASALKAFADDLKGFETSKGTIRFTAESPLPVALLKKLVKARMAENDAKADRKAVLTKAARKPAKKLLPRTNGTSSRKV